MIVLLVIGMGIGCIYALVAAGYALIYRTTGIVNFAQGSFVMVGGMTAFWFRDVVHLPYLLAGVLGVLASAGVGLVLWLLIALPMWQRGVAGYVLILGTLVFSLLVEDVVLRWQGTDPKILPPWVGGFDLHVGQATLSGQYVLIVVAMAAVLLLLGAFLRYSSLGRAMRTCASDRETSALLGVSPARMGGIAMVMTSAIGGLGGLLITPVQYTAYNAGLTYAIFGFVAGVLGGFGSLSGAVVGGILLGVIQQLTARYLSSSYETFIAFGLLLVLLTVRPRGLLGSRWAEA